MLFVYIFSVEVEEHMHWALIPSGALQFGDPARSYNIIGGVLLQLYMLYINSLLNLHMLKWH